MQIKTSNFLVIILALKFLLQAQISTGQACNNWLKLTDNLDGVTIGDLDISGNQLTVEAFFNRTAPYAGGYSYAGDIVSKHLNRLECNYLLRPAHAEITTEDGFFATPASCDIELNRTYHVAMVYDGNTLKFYRNGFLLEQVNATGNLITNDWLTKIGETAGPNPDDTQFRGFINEVKIWKVARTQQQIRANMSGSLSAPTSETGLLAYYTFNDLSNKQGNAQWAGSIVGGATINSTNTSCSFVADSCGRSCAGIAGMDFEFDRNICTPRLVQFSTRLSDIQAFDWDLGDGRTSSSSNPSVEYSSYGEYTVKLKARDVAGCEDSISKKIVVGVQSDDIIVTSDTTICAGDSFQLRTIASGLGVCWQPAEGLSSSSIPSPIAKPTSSTTYQFTSQVRGTNLVANGDFSNGNTGFSSDYTYSNSGIPAAVYTVATDPPSWHPAMPPCKDHTSGTGNMMMVNGSEQLNSVVWSEIIPVTPNTEYVFSSWLETVTTINPAQLQFSINGETIGNIFTANVASCKWDQFYATWKSGSSTVATISIVNMNQGFSGNDFALDDIFFGELSMKTESIRIIVSSLPKLNVGLDTSICSGAKIQLNSNSATSNLITWSPALFLNNAGVANPIASPLENITYTATAKNSDGCYKTDTIVIRVGDINVSSLFGDTSVCAKSLLQLSVSGADTYEWFPATGLSNTGVFNPVALVDTTITYIVTGTTSEGCTANDTIRIQSLQNPVVVASNDTVLCGSGSVVLHVSGATQYKWGPGTGLDVTTASSPLATIDSSVTYMVEGIAQNGCSGFDTVQITVLPIPKPILSADTSICGSDSVQLAASGGRSYRWTPANGLTSPSIADPIAKIVGSITYTVMVTSDNGCIAVDSTSIILLNKPDLQVSSDTTVCAGSSVTLEARGAAQYNWSPAAGLINPDTAITLAQINSSQTYLVTALSHDGCLASDSVRIAVLPAPLVSIAGDTVICKNDVVQLYATGGVHYEWSPSTGLNDPLLERPTATPMNNVTYHVKVTDDNQCSTTDSVAVAVKSAGDFSISTSASQICAGVPVQLVANGGQSYQWQPSDNLADPAVFNPIVRPLDNTVYSVTIKDSVCNRDTILTVPVAVNPLPKVTVSKANDITCSDAASQLNATGGKEYRWAPSAGLSNPFIANPVATVGVSTTFHVTAVSEHGCEATDSITVNFMNSGNLIMRWFPTAFTPNGDGLNDCFGAQKLGAVQLLQMSIFNRWGELVFKGFNASDCWDGTFKGLPQQTGVFPYILKAETSCGMIEKKGTVLLIR